MEIHTWLTETRASDVMISDVLTVWPTHTLAQVSAVLLREHVSAVPVVLRDGPCVGVFSLSDFIRAEEEVAGARQEIFKSSYFTADLALPEDICAERLKELQTKAAPVAEHPVSDFMTSNLISVLEDTRLEKVVGTIVDAHVHRLIVLDENRKLRGIISTIDVLREMVQASLQP